jgi:hypothetical protein
MTIKPKKEGGLGSEISMLFSFDMAMLSKQARRLPQTLELVCSGAAGEVLPWTVVVFIGSAGEEHLYSWCILRDI